MANTWYCPNRLRRPTHIHTHDSAEATHSYMSGGHTSSSFSVDRRAASVASTPSGWGNSSHIGRNRASTTTDGHHWPHTANLDQSRPYTGYQQQTPPPSHRGHSQPQLPAKRTYVETRVGTFFDRAMSSRCHLPANLQQVQQSGSQSAYHGQQLYTTDGRPSQDHPDIGNGYYGPPASTQAGGTRVECDDIYTGEGNIRQRTGGRPATPYTDDLDCEDSSEDECGGKVGNILHC